VNEQLAAMAAAAGAAAVAHPLRGEVRRTDPDSHYQATRLGEAPVDQLHLICAYLGCGQSVACLTYDVTAGGYVWTLEQLSVPVAAHVRQCHGELLSPLPPRA
jgi:hypothetical protein